MESAKETGQMNETRTLTWPPQMEATRRRSRPDMNLIRLGGYWYAGVPPIASSVSLANGQQSTDPNGASPFPNERTRLRTPQLNHASAGPGGAIQRLGRGLTRSLPGRDSAQQYQSARINQIVVQIWNVSRGRVRKEYDS